MRLKRPLQTRFRYGSPTRVNLATHHNSQAHSSKGTHHITHTTKVCASSTACRHTVSGTISRPLTGALFTFPSRYSSTIGHQEVFRLTRWSWQIHTGFHGPRATREHSTDSRHDFAYRTLTVYGAPSQRLRLPHRFITAHRDGGLPRKVPQPRTRNARRLSHAHGLASSAFAHHYSRNHYCFLFLRVLRCFTSPRYHQPPYTFRRRQHPMTGARFPHSDIPGSTSVADSPRHIAGSHVLHRLLMPRHPPCALKNLATKMLASTMQFSNNKQTTSPHPPPPPEPGPQQHSTSPSRYDRRPALQRKQPPTPTTEQPHTPARDSNHPTPRQTAARFLRTQQCAQPTRDPAASAFPLPNPTPRSVENRRY